MDPAEAAGQAKQAGVPLDTVGGGQRYQTTLVGGRLVDGVDEQALQAIATATGGHYFFAADESQLNRIYSDLGTRIGFTTTKVDLTIPVLALGTLILIVGGLFSLRWFRLLP